MKAQAALIESLASLVLLGSVGATFASMAYVVSYQPNSYSQQNLYYDIIGIIYGNQSARECAEYPIRQCASLLLGTINTVYGLDYSSITTAGLNASVGNAALCTRSNIIFVPIPENKSYTEARLFVCGG